MSASEPLKSSISLVLWLSLSPSGVGSTCRPAKAVISIFLAVYVGLSVLTIFTVNNMKRLPVGEKPVLVAVVAGLPLLFVRILFSILANFHMDGIFRSFMATFRLSRDCGTGGVRYRHYLSGGRLRRPLQTATIERWPKINAQ